MQNVVFFPPFSVYFSWGNISLSKKEIIKIAQDLWKTKLKEAKFTSEVLLDACNHDAYNEAEECVYDKDFKKFSAIFTKRHGGYNSTGIIEHPQPVQLKEAPKKKIKITKSSNDNNRTDFSFVPKDGIATNIIAFKNNKVALTDAFMGYAGGILYLYNIVYNGLPLPLEDACRLIK